MLTIRHSAQIKFIIKWLVISIFILAIPSIAMFDRGNPDTALAGLFLFLIGLSISMAILGAVLWSRLRQDVTLVKSKMIVTIAMFLPLAIVVFIGIHASLDAMRNERIRRYTVHTQTMNIYVDGYTMEQRYFFRLDGNLGSNYHLLQMTRVMLENEQTQQKFEYLFDVTLPKIDFNNYFFRVLPGQRYDRLHDFLYFRYLNPYEINIYIVNRVR